MKIISKKNNIIVVKKLIIADNPISRTIGLLLKKSFEAGEGLLIKPCNSIHSHFMRFSFDAVFLDKENKIVYLIKQMSPWKISPIIRSAYSILEIPSGTAAIHNLEINDVLEILE